MLRTEAIGMRSHITYLSCRYANSYYISQINLKRMTELSISSCSWFSFSAVHCMSWRYLLNLWAYERLYWPCLDVLKCMLFLFFVQCHSQQQC